MAMAVQPTQIWSALTRSACIVDGKNALISGKGALYPSPLQKGLVLFISNMQTNARSSRNYTVTTEMLKEESTSVDSVSGDNIRRIFLEFYAARGHKILPGSSLVPDDPTVLLTIAGMLQFKPIFLGQVPRQVPCAVTSQKCIRTNDIENVGRTTRHHTFFEMLGNFSFGDYFKTEAILWAWELATKGYKLDPDNIWVSVYEDDNEALEIWRDQVKVPGERIKKMDQEDNFWSSGPTGPCGPCSEMYYDFHPERGTHNAELGDDTRFLEFYNLVFMQYNRKDNGDLEPLKQRNIDTGLGLERLARILQKVPNNYEIDLIYPIIKRATELAGISYSTADELTKTHLKVIGDHTRAVVYLISDGVNPSNIGRGYVVRRLIRRIVRMGRLIRINTPTSIFLPTLAQVVVDMSSNIDPEVKRKSDHIYDELEREEVRFVQTLERGEKLLSQKLEEAIVKENRMLSGKDVFILYDTYGFPVEITEEAANERGVKVDMAGFEHEMENQRRQSQEAHNVVKLSAVNGETLVDLVGLEKTEFVGYSKLEVTAKVVALVTSAVNSEAREGEEVQVMLDRTPFYAESGGQIADNGLLFIKRDALSTEMECTVQVKDVKKLGETIVHYGVVERGNIRIGDQVTALVESNLRRRAQAHHTATHLLQAALKKVLGNETSQAGSLVAFDRLRFDFTLKQKKIKDEQVKQVENLVNHWISEAVDLRWRIMPLDDAKKAGAIAMFGEKYGQEVRVVDVPGISMELCGGTHVGNTGEIRGFQIVSLEGIASGVKRIEAVAGDAFIDYVFARDNVIKQLCSNLKVKPEELSSRVEGLQEETKSLKHEIKSLKLELAIAKAKSLSPVVGASGVRILVGDIGNTPVESLRACVEHMCEVYGDPYAILLGSCTEDAKVSLVAAFSESVVQHGLNAGAFVGSIARLCGGGGGGKADIAQAGGKIPENLPSAIEEAYSQLSNMLAGFHM